MRALSEAELLQAWDVGGAEPPNRRALLLLRAADADANPEGLSIGRRDRLLLELRVATFGPVLDCRARCPACDEPLSFSVAIAALTDALRTDPPPEIRFRHESFEVGARVPNCADLLAIGSDGTAHDLARRCLTSLRQDGVELDCAAAPSPLLDALDAELAASDAERPTALALICPACSHAWDHELDAARFVWAELDAWGSRVIDEVHRLASAYHWSEAEILRLGYRRRQRYLELVDA